MMQRKVIQLLHGLLPALSNLKNDGKESAGGSMGLSYRRHCDALVHKCVQGILDPYPPEGMSIAA